MTSTLGSVDLNAYLPTVGVDLAGWSLSDASGISADGSAIAGVGTFNGEQASWIVSSVPVPEPGALALFAAGSTILRRRTGANSCS